MIVSRAPLRWYSVNSTKQIENRHMPINNQSNSTKCLRRSVFTDMPVIISNVDLPHYKITHRSVASYTAAVSQLLGSTLRRLEKKSISELSNPKCWVSASEEYSLGRPWSSWKSFVHLWSWGTPWRWTRRTARCPESSGWSPHPWTIRWVPAALLWGQSTSSFLW